MFTDRVSAATATTPRDPDPGEPGHAGASAQLRRRAAVHAALGDPARLTIVDTLSWGDASPSELQQALRLPSNLLAHHLRVLERAGVLRRTRSEGDRRRTYLGLVPDALPWTEPVPGRDAPRVVFVCTQNSARSQLAAALWHASSEVPATSAGTHPAPALHPGAIAAAGRHDLDLTAARPRELADVLRPADLVITVCDSAHEELGPRPDRLHWAVPDPVRHADAPAFDRAVADLAVRIAHIAPTIQRARGGDHAEHLPPS